MAKLVRLMSLRAPMRVPRSRVSSTSQESSITFSPCSSAMARMTSQSGQLPIKLGVMMALVRGPIISGMRFTSIWKVSGSTSTKTGTSPSCTMEDTSVEKVSTEVMISSPGSRSSSPMPRSSAEDPELTITPSSLPSTVDTSSSKRATFSPMLRSPERSTSSTASISRSSWIAPAGGRVRVG